MDGVPSPLQIASPPTARRPSEPQVPEGLRAGSPVIGATASPQARPPLIRKNTSGASDRLSQLFQSRTSSAASITPPDSTSRSRRTSFPSALVPASDPAYRIPRAPAPPSFHEDTSYDPTPNSYSQPDAPPTVQSRSGTKQLLSRLTSLSRGNSKGGRYQKLDDEESGRLRGGRLRGVEEEDEAIGYDLSGFDGLPMKGFEPKTKSLNTADVDDRDHDIREASHIAEFERLEAQLGAGMTSILQKPFTHTPAEPVQRSATRHKRHKSVEAVASEQAKDAQIEAEKTGDIVAVPFDISESIAGADFDRRSSMATASTALAKDEVQTSYYFPPDPDMPSWRPFTMGWPWIAGLVIVAVCLAGVQEYLCQISMKNVREDPKNGGLAHFEKAGDLTVAMYFAWQYAPIMIFVFYGILWQMTDFEVKRLEPFYQLSKKTGATAGESLNMDYLTFMSWLVPLRALRHKQFAVIYSSLGTLIASSLLPVLQSASLEMYPPKSQRDTQAMKSIRVDPRWSRAVSASLLLVAFCGGALMYAMRRKSGLQSNPKGIAGIAAMATKSHILADFRGLDTAPLNKIHKQLRHRRYILHKSSLWQGEYIRNSRDKIRETGTDPRPLMLRKRLGIPFVGFLLAFTGGIPVLMFLPKASIVTEKLPWLTTGLATIIRIMWNTMNCDVRMLQPFFILAKRHAPAKTLTLDYAGTNPLWLPFQAAFNGHWLVMLVAIGSILTELLTVCVSSISVDGKRFMPGAGGQDWDDDHDGNNNDANDRYNTEQTFRSFWSSLALTMLILIYLIAIAILTYMRRSHKFMPRQIGTMASVLAFIHQSKMLVNFVDTEMYDSGKMTKHLETGGKKYALGWFAGRDGEDHLGIDEEEVLSEYKYGVDWTNSRITGMQVGMWERY